MRERAADVDGQGSDGMTKPTLPVGVSVLLVNRDRRVALGERAENISAGGLLSTPGGRIEENERLQGTAARELEEETGTPGGQNRRTC